MVKIRLTRLGKHKAPFYRIIATDARVKRDGKYIALLGTYEPFEGTPKLKTDEILKFLLTGAQPTDTCLSMLKKEGIWAQYLKIKADSKKPTKAKKLKPKSRSKTTATEKTPAVKKPKPKSPRKTVEKTKK